MLTLILLAQIATARPMPTPTISPRATPLTRTVNANEGLSGLASRIKVDKAAFAKGTPRTVGPEPGYTPRTDAACRAKEFAQKLDGVVQKFSGIESVATTTSRIALGGPMTELAKVRAEAAGLSGPPCADTLKSAALTYMDLSISEMQAFQMKEEYSRVPRNRALQSYNAELGVILIGQ